MPICDDIIKGVPTARYSDYTQNITNQFPEWHVVRRHRDSTAAKIINSTAGVEMEHIVDRELPNLVTQRIPTIANEDPNEFAYTIKTPKQTSSSEEVIYNRLFNSAFDIWQNPCRPPDGWIVEVEDTPLLPLFNLIAANVDENYQGGKSLIIRNIAEDATTFGDTVFYQDVEIGNDEEETKWSASLWTKRSGLEVIDPDFFKLFVQVYYKDAANPPPVELAIQDSEDWKRNTIKITTNAKILKIRVGIKFDPGVSGTLKLLLATSFFLHEGHTDNFWARHREDKPPFIEALQTGRTVMLTGYDLPNKINFFGILESDLNSALLPTHADIEFFPINEPPPSPPVSPVRVHSGYLIDSSRIPQGVVIGNTESMGKYKWGTWCLGKLVKFNLIDPSEITGVYLPSFPITSGNLDDRGFVEAITSIEMQAVAKRGEYLWIIAKVKQGSSLGFMRNVDLMLFVISCALPKVVNSEEEVDPTQPVFLPILYTYYFKTIILPGPYGTDPYGAGPFGGAESPISPTKIRHLSMEFISNRQIKSIMEYGYESLITMKKNYYLDDGKQVILLRDPISDFTGAKVVVW